MKRWVWVMAALLAVATAGPAWATDQQSKATAKIAARLSSALKGIGSTISLTAKEAGKAELKPEAEMRKLLLKNVSGRPYAVDATFIDSKGIMMMIEPSQYRGHEGSDISKQEAIIKMLRTKKPGMGNAFVSVEGIKSIDIEYPVFSKGKRFLGSVSLLIRHDEMIRSVAAEIEKELGVQCWVMQTNGFILYDTNPVDTGRNLLKDPRYRDFPELQTLAKRMIKKKAGSGFYSFESPGTKTIVKKRAVWKTIRFLDNDWIVVTYNEVR